VRSLERVLEIFDFCEERFKSLKLERDRFISVEPYKTYKAYKFGIERLEVERVLSWREVGVLRIH
jgi:hypothetical protein